MLAIQYEGDLNDPYASYAENPSKDLIVFLVIRVCSIDMRD